MAELAHITTVTAPKGSALPFTAPAAVACVAIESAHPDALLIALGACHDAAFANWKACYAAWVAAQGAFNTISPLRDLLDLSEYLDAWKACGGDAICKASEDAWETVQWIQNDALGNPAYGSAGLCVKARIIRALFEADAIAGGEGCPEVAEYHAVLLREYAEEAKQLGLSVEVFQ